MTTNHSSNFIRGSYAKIKRAWLLTWEWAGKQAEIKDKFVAIISSRYKDDTVKQTIEQYYVSGYLSLHEQLSYAKSKKHCLHKAQNITIEVLEELQKESSLPSRVPFSESIIIGGNPWLWGRIVYDLETWIDEKGIEHLKWKERENISPWNGSKIKSDWRDGHLKRQRYMSFQVHAHEFHSSNKACSGRSRKAKVE